MNYLKGRLVKLVVDFWEDDFRRITHALAVMRYSEIIMPDFCDYDHDIILAAALLHDVGIKPSEAQLGYNNGKTQEQYGPAVAAELLRSIGFPEEKIKKVAEIIGNHHSADRYDYVELKILKLADRIVNAADPD